MVATTHKPFQLRDRANFLNYVGIELHLIKKEWKILLPCVLMQYIHAIFHNIAYWIQGNKLTVEQRFTLYDLGFDLMPELSEGASHISEYLVFGAVFAPGILLVLSIALFKQDPAKPRYMAIILKRLLLHISIALFLRIISFLVTALPGSARQCRLIFDEACLQQNPNNTALCVTDNKEFIPPSTTELFTRIDALKGCGDLMFSSHTIYTLSIILTVLKYWWNKYLAGLMISVQIAIAFLIVASRKHYTLDVFTALYVVPMLWALHEAYLKDINHKDVQITAKSIHEFYGVDVSEDLEPHPASVQTDVEQGLSVTPTTPENGSAAPFQRKNSM